VEELGLAMGERERGGSRERERPPCGWKRGRERRRVRKKIIL